MLKRSLLVALAFLLGLSLMGRGAEDRDKKDPAEKPKYFNTTYVPTADEVIAKMFEMAKVTKDDVIFDLGCGDGRILYQAAKKHGARGIGIELNPIRVREAMDQAEKYDVGTLVEIRHADALKVKDIGDATVVVMYMFPEFMDLWFPIAKEKLKPGTRIVSHDYSWTKGWKPTDTATVKSTARDNHKVLLWVVPSKERSS
jgi:cyclopropane fatty-acyl-phospholipid synthase-like methyltransferase